MRAKVIEIYHLKSGLKTFLDSDNLWGNLCWAFRYLYGEKVLSEFLDSYLMNEPQLILSSAFPFYRQDNKTRYFFPRPILPPKDFSYIRQQNAQKKFHEKIQDIAQRKKQKKILFLEKEDFQKVILGEMDADNMNFQEYPKWISNSVTKNQINRIKGGTIEIKGTGQLFAEEEWFLNFSDDFPSGLFFWAHDHTHGKLEAALRLLSHIGIGGNRTTGKGVFDFLVHDLELIEPENPNLLTNLSLYAPTPNELQFFQTHKERFFYQLENKTGTFGELKNGQYRKKTTTLFKEGSVFPFLEQKSYGFNKKVYQKRENILNDYDVYQLGMPFMLKMFVKI